MLNGKSYALKEIPKYKLYKSSKIFSHLKEPEILKKITKYNFVPQLVSSFQDYDYLYLVTTYYEGKNFQHFRKNNMTEEQIKFVSACVIQALEYLRNEQIIHREVCPVNIIMDSEREFKRAYSFHSALSPYPPIRL